MRIVAVDEPDDIAVQPQLGWPVPGSGRRRADRIAPALLVCVRVGRGRTSSMCALRSSFVWLSALALLVTACASDSNAPGSRNSVFNSVFGADLAARQPRQSASDEAGGTRA